MPLLDATEIYPGLYQGSKPPQGRALANAGFNAVVLAAREYQPRGERFPGLDAVIAVPLDDSGYPPTPGEQRAAVMAARAVTNIVRSGRKVLVTCYQGRNRSGLIVGLTIAELLPDANRVSIIDAIQEARPGSLSNRWFETMVRTAPRRQRRAVRRSLSSYR